MKKFIKIFALILVVLVGFSLTASAWAEDEIVAPSTTIPTVTFGSIGDISDTTAVLNGVVTSDGGSPVLSAGFSWAAGGIYTNAISTPDHLNSDGTFQETLTGLRCATTYNYGAFAINSVGTAITGSDMTFTTANCPPAPRSPIVEILQFPASVSATSATLSGIIKQSGTTAITEAGFNWGTTPSYGNKFSTTTATVSGDDFFKNLSNLNCETTYHYNVFATNSVGTGSTSDSTFVTSDCPAPNTGGSNGNDAGGIIPNTGGSNANDAQGIIPTVGGSNANDASPTIIPTAGGSNGNDTTPIITPAIDTQSRNTGGSSSTGSTGSRASGNFIAGDSAGSCVAITNSLRKGATGTQVLKLQELLNKFGDANLVISGNYDDLTEQAVKNFQIKYASEILAPWGVTDASGFVSFTTLKKLNELSCGQNFPLSSVEQALIARYKVNLPEVTPTSTTTPSVAPIEVGANTVTPDQNSTQTAGVANTEVSNSIFTKIINFFKNIF